MTPVQVTPVTESLEQQVGRLLAAWRAETAHLSSSTRITSHPAYQEIIALGTPALPFLFRDLEQTLDGHLSKALTAITGAHPVPAQERGQIGKVAAAWLRWARENDLHDVAGEAYGTVVVLLKRPMLPASGSAPAS